MFAEYRRQVNAEAARSLGLLPRSCIIGFLQEKENGFLGNSTVIDVSFYHHNTLTASVRIDLFK